MNLLIISDEQEDFLSTEKINKDFNSIFLKLSSKKFYEQVKNNSNIPLCIIFVNDEKNLEKNDLLKIFSVAGFLQAKNIQIVSNIDLLNCSFSNSKVEHISSVDELNKYLETNQEKLIQTDEKLQAQNELLEKGIPVCPSCFALCIGAHLVPSKRTWGLIVGISNQTHYTRFLATQQFVFDFRKQVEQ